MKFIIKKVSTDKKPCENAFSGIVYFRNIKTIKSFDLNNKFIKENWFNEGYNHRQEDDCLVKDYSKRIWFIYIDNITELNNLTLNSGKIIMEESNYHDINLLKYYEITIYDDYI